ncbi:MAG: hypothetical protein HY872_09470 [Chloroflexi bacterium]|nr:hypothetical protein [Chloroflexota bacterium]MBI5830270.1 hypothetical protein [Chloroflexota bacterium]
MATDLSRQRAGGNFQARELISTLGAVLALLLSAALLVWFAVRALRTLFGIASMLLRPVAFVARLVIAVLRRVWPVARVLLPRIAKGLMN